MRASERISGKVAEMARSGFDHETRCGCGLLYVAKRAWDGECSIRRTGTMHPNCPEQTSLVVSTIAFTRICETEWSEDEGFAAKTGFEFLGSFSWHRFTSSL